MTTSTSTPAGLAVVAFTVLAAGALAFATAAQGPAVLLSLPGLAAAAALLTRPEIGLLLLSATIPVQAAVMIAEQVTAPKLVGILVAGAWLLRKLVRRESWAPILSDGATWLALIFLALAAASTLWGETGPGTSRQLTLLVQLIVLGVVVSDLGSSWTWLDRAVKLLVLGAFVAGVLIIAQFALSGVRRAGEGVTGGSVNSAARVMVTALPFAFYLVRASPGRGWRAFGSAFILVAVAAVVTTFSRTSFLLLPPVILFYYGQALRTRKRLGWLAVPIVAAVLAFPLLPRERVSSRIATIAPYLAATVGERESGEISSGRGYHLRIALAIFADHPVLGSGYGSYGQQFLAYQWDLPGARKVYLSQRSSHGSHAGLLAELGAAGALLWVGLFIALGRGLLRSWRRCPRAHGSVPAEILLALIVSMALQALYGFAADIHQNKLFWLLVGLCIAAKRLADRPRAAAPAAPPPDRDATRGRPRRLSPPPTFHPDHERMVAR
jgi:O-antigen ligase